jgi:hypothetical protein
MTNAELLDLLREARGCVSYARSMCPDKPIHARWDDRKKLETLLDNIDAALAERQDSATDVVESEPVEWSRVGRWSATVVGDVFCQVQRGVDFWNWDTSQTGLAPTEAEAKFAAIAAARRMR